jgi:gamma-glutamyltranspeptidase / glutathione hydrolase
MPELGPFATHYASAGLVCSVDHVASGAGLAMLAAGGTAADAAIAAGAVLTVTTPHMCGMGGDLFALVHHERGAPEVLNASGRAGSGADPDRLRAEGHQRMPYRGDIRSVPVPGCVDGWLALHERFGHLPLAQVLEPAIRLAGEGFAISALLAAMLPLVREVTGAEDFFGSGPPRPGDVVRRPGTARALTAIVEGGRSGFYGGEFGEGLLALGRGEYSPADLASSCAAWVEPLGLSVWGHDVWTVPPNSQGYLTSSAAWIASGLELPEDPLAEMWPHLLVEAARQAGADRPAVLHEHADGAQLLSPGRLAPRRAAVSRERASNLPTPTHGGDTIYLCAVDDRRMGVSLIQSNAADFGCHLAEPGTGTFLHNRGIGFSLEPGHPAAYGSHRRPPSTLSPALVTRPDGTLRAVLGTMGGDAQPQILLQLLARLIPARQRPGTVVSSPRWVLAPHGESVGFDTWSDLASIGVDVESRAPDTWLDGLRRRGHAVRVRDAFHHGVGHAHLIEVGDNGSLAGASDPRAGSGAAVGR